MRDAVRWRIGLDVGSTTVKAVVVDAETDEIVWKDYQRHETRQPEKVLAFLTGIERSLGHPDLAGLRIFVTGSGGAALAEVLGAKFVQEVNAVSLAVEKVFPEAGSVIELGGQDAKIIIFKEDPRSGRKKKLPSMNDKCAGGTGAVIDKIRSKLNLTEAELRTMRYDGVKLHPVAGKCGVFAETDINGLQKQGVPASELMASLFDAIVQQNLTVLTRGNTLRPHVLLLGGPNTFIPGMVEAWQAAIPRIWNDRGLPLPPAERPEDLILVPEDAQYYAAIGAVEFGKEEASAVAVYRGSGPLREQIERGVAFQRRAKSSGRGLVRDGAELEAFLDRHRREPFRPVRFRPGQRVEAYLGIDGGSTSTKAVLLAPDRTVLAKSYGLSLGNPIEDTRARVRDLRGFVEGCGATLEITGVGTTGYAKDVLRDVLRADAAIVETVAHTESALHYYDDVDVVCDVGGQDIKIIALKHGKVRDFRLNTQCSAGNGYFLQSTAAAFGFDVSEYAAAAFEAREYPVFGYGCAVFLQSDIVDFQRQGWERQEIMAGLAAVLPKNIWLYVSQIPNLAKLGRRFVLQGGTQHNLAAVKAQVDFIRGRFHDDCGGEPDIFVHEHAGESGAIGAALEAVRLHEGGRRTEFIGLDAVERITYRTTRNESTRCSFCRNKCLRTFLDIRLDGEREEAADPMAPAAPAAELSDETRRLILSTCEKGGVEDLEAMRSIREGMEEVKRVNPDMAAYAARRAWQDFHPAAAGGRRRRRRAGLRIGIPRVLNLYNLAPFFTAYLQSVGVRHGNFVFSDTTSEQLFREGAKRGAIDPCFPSKVAIAHVHNLLTRKHHPRRPLDWILLPMIDSLPVTLDGTTDSRACPTATVTPETVKAAFTKESDVFAEKGVRYVSPFLNFAEPDLLQRQMRASLGPLLGLGRIEARRACRQGLSALASYREELKCEGRGILDRLERENRLGIVLLGRPYHADPGLQHGILESLQKRGYPILTQDSLPDDDEFLDPLFGVEIASGVIRSGRDISDVWKNSYSTNTNRKIWAAKVCARHPNLVGLELSSFKCGHDAPIYTVIEEIVERSRTPFFAFRDIDENKPAGSIKIRVETISYFLARYREDMIREENRLREIEAEVRAYEDRLRADADRVDVA